MNARLRSITSALCAAGSLALSVPAAAADKYSALDITPPDVQDCYAGPLNKLGQVVGNVHTFWAAGSNGFITGPNGANPTMIGTLEGGDYSSLFGINDRGQAVGNSSVPPDYHAHVILLEPGSNMLTDLGSFGGTYAAGKAINNKGRIAGFANKANGTLYGFVSRGAQHRLTPIGANLWTTAINATGMVTGSLDSETDRKAFITGPDATGVTVLGSLGGMIAMGLDLNDSGVVVGFSTNEGETWQHAFVTDAGGSNLRDLGLPGNNSAAQGVNNKGRIVGRYIDMGVSRAFIASATGGYKDLNTQVTLPGGVLLAEATGINDKGQIAASGSDQRCYLLTPLAP